MCVVRKLRSEDGRSVYSVIHKAAGQGVLSVGTISETVPSGGSKGVSRDAPSPTRWSKFFQFHAVFGQIWQNHMLAPPRELAPLLGEILDPPLVLAGSSNSCLMGVSGIVPGKIMERPGTVRSEVLLIALIVVNISCRLEFIDKAMILFVNILAPVT